MLPLLAGNEPAKGHNLSHEDLLLRISLTEIGGSGQAVAKKRNVKQLKITKYICPRGLAGT